MNKILEYQKLESELINIEKKVNRSNAMKDIDKATNNAMSAKSEMKDLNKRSGELLDEFAKLQEIMKTNIDNIQKLEKQKFADKEQIKKAYDNIQKVNNNLNIIEQRLNKVNKDIAYVLKKFQRVKEMASTSKEKKAKAQEQFDKIKETVASDKDGIKEQMVKLAKEIEPQVFERYQKVRKENIFPVYVKAIEENDSMRCGGCKTLLPVGRVGLLKSNGYVECEECRRIIYLGKNEK